MKLTGLHLLLTYQCTFACDHCFVWGSPWQEGVMTLAAIERILQAARETGTVNSIYFEGGEPALYYATLLAGVRQAAAMGFEVGIVTNAYWAISEADAAAWLAPFVGLIEAVTISSDRFHYSEKYSRQARNAQSAAQNLGVPIGMITIAQPDEAGASGVGQLPEGEGGVMYRGRAAAKLADKAPRRPWEQFTACPHEDLREPGRVHVDPLGNLHLCQGLILGNLFAAPLRQICDAYTPDADPVIGPLLEGGPAGLARRYALPVESGYADACHLCYQARLALRERFPAVLGPDQMYGRYDS